MSLIQYRGKLLFMVGLVLALAGCYTNPVTGRQYAVMTSLGEELQLGAQAFADVKKQETISRNPEVNARIQRIGKRIASAVGNQLPGAQWEFVVFDSPELNAFALPGGKVGIYTGLIDLGVSDDELAQVMGHEIGHVVARHGGKRMTEATVVGLVGAAGAIAVDRKYGSEKSQLFALAYGGISTVGYVLPHSRGDESEADLMGLQYAAQAGYDPDAAVTLWQKMAAASGQSKVPVWLSTHPSNSQRISNLRAAAPRFKQLYLTNRSRYE
jgi:metalloendopeptidase OMA1, mitochondrial